MLGAQLALVKLQNIVIFVTLMFNRMALINL